MVPSITASKTRPEEHIIEGKIAEWDGELLLAQGWAHYHGPAGETSFHSHYPAQIVFSGSRDTTVALGDRHITGRFLVIPSNERHMLAPSRECLDLLYIEPTFLERANCEGKTLANWLAALRHRKVAINDTRMIRAVEAIEGALCGKIAQKDIAYAAGMSKSSFTTLFRANIGMPLRRYVLWRRLNVAVAAIGEGANATLAAHTAGFSDSAHFSRTMKETFGVSLTDSVLKIQMTVA